MSLMHGARANITEAIGNTPIVRLNKVASHVKSTIYVKCEYLNPGGSMKDRVALNILAECFPDRAIVGIHAVDLVWGLGTLHCLSQQEPAPAR